MACVVAEQRLKLLAFRSLSSRVMPRDEPSHCFSSGRAATKPSFCAPSSQSTSQAQRWCSRQPMRALGFARGSLPAHARTQTSKRAHARAHTRAHTHTSMLARVPSPARAHTHPRLRKHAHAPTHTRTHPHRTGKHTRNIHHSARRPRLAACWPSPPFWTVTGCT